MNAQAQYAQPKLEHLINPENPDLIVCWPKNLDYPPFRLFVRLYRLFFNQVFIVFTPYESVWDFTNEVTQHMLPDRVSFMYVFPSGSEDWRNKAVNSALNLSVSKHVLFMEQDFLIRSGEDLETIWSKRENFDVIGFKQEERLHPAFLLVARRLIDKTSRDFAAHPPESDHFDKFTEELKGSKLLLDDIGIGSGVGYRHLNGLSHNFALCMKGEKPNHNPKDFEWWLDNSMENIEVSEKYKMLVEQCKKVLARKD